MRHILYGRLIAATLVGVMGCGASQVRDDPAGMEPFNAGGLRAFDLFLLESVSETSSNASVGDLNGDGHPDIVLVKGRHWQLTSRTFFGDGKGHFASGPALPSKATKSYSGSLADMPTLTESA